jgi:hypothetical protein
LVPFTKKFAPFPKLLGTLGPLNTGITEAGTVLPKADLPGKKGTNTLQKVNSKRTKVNNEHIKATVSEKEVE